MKGVKAFSPDELAVRQIPRQCQPAYCYAEQIRILPIVEPVGEFIQVALQML